MKKLSFCLIALSVVALGACEKKESMNNNYAVCPAYSATSSTTTPASGAVVENNKDSVTVKEDSKISKAE